MASAKIKYAVALHPKQGDDYVRYYNTLKEAQDAHKKALASGKFNVVEPVCKVSSGGKFLGVVKKKKRGYWAGILY